MIRFMRADSGDAHQLTQICQISKGFWGYTQSMMDQWRAELTVTSDYIKKNLVMKIYQRNNLVGFFALENHHENHHIEHLWLLPEYIGKGIGHVVLNHIKNQLVPANQEIRLVADPNAERFYFRNGFITYDFYKSSIKNRTLPMMKWTSSPDY